MTRRLPFAGCGTAETMPVARGEVAVERLVEAIDRRGRQQAVERLQPRRGRARAEGRIERLGERGAVLRRACWDRGSAGRSSRSARPIAWTSDSPELLGHAHDEDPAVRRREGLDRRQRQMRAARHARRDVAFVQVPERRDR